MAQATLGFIGLGVMGAPMCRNLAQKSGCPVVSYDRATRPEGSVRAVSEADVVFLSLPGAAEVREVCTELLSRARPGQAIVDCSTAPVALAQELARAFSSRGAGFADAPVARTRQAAMDGTLSIMVGADEALFRRIEPLLRCMASDVTHCGAPGAGQAVKLLNNLVLSMTVMALATA